MDPSQSATRHRFSSYSSSSRRVFFRMSAKPCPHRLLRLISSTRGSCYVPAQASFSGVLRVHMIHFHAPDYSVHRQAASANGGFLGEASVICETALGFTSGVQKVQYVFKPMEDSVRRKFESHSGLRILIFRCMKRCWFQPFSS